jgi:DNA topoisomerase-3
VVGVIKNGEIPDVVTPPCRRRARSAAAVQENYRKFQCQKCDFSLWKVISGREWSPEEWPS